MVKITKKFSGGDPRKWLQDTINRIESENRASMSDAIQDGSQSMKEHIATRPTAWMAANRGKTGRIETGKMLDAVGSKVTSNTSQKWTGAFGWVNETEGYFLRQEDGGRNSFTGGEIEAMNAMRDAADQTWDQLVADIEGNVRGA